ncbi:unnamed protein product [Diamesa serratosioi]
MPFIEDDLLWCPTNDGRMVSDFQCIQDMAGNNVNQQQQQQDMGNCDLTNLDPLNCNDSDELLRQLTENTFELDTFFSEFTAAEIKEENNNDVQLESSNNQNQQNFNCNELNLENNLAILQNRLLVSNINKLGLTLNKGEFHN